MKNRKSTYIKDESIQDMFLKSSGRLNRLRFFKRILAVGFFNIIAVIILAAIFEGDLKNPSSSFLIISMAISIACLIPYYFLYVRRLQDLNMNNKLAIINTVANFICLFSSDDLDNASMIAAIAGLVAGVTILYLLFADGTHGTNYYGPDPLGRDN
ncbi:MAG: DUF805 domain-containing protein [Selenomonadaceae bacterium]|nr:DUF805 domain-containing protein [Selenomonadaceae bacterium]